MVEPWIKETTGDRPFARLQDNAPSHTSRKSQRWISDPFFDITLPEVWPPNSADFNPMDFYEWGAFDRDTNRTTSKIREELSTWIKAGLVQLSRDTISKSCFRFRGQIETIIEIKAASLITSLVQIYLSILLKFCDKLSIHISITLRTLNF